MPAPRRLPDDDTLTRLYRQGLTSTAIAAAYGVRHPAVLAHWQRLGLPGRTPRHGVMPWTVADTDQHAPPAVHVRTLAGAARGRVDLTGGRVDSAVRWARHMTARNLAVTYARGTGFGTRPARRHDRRVRFLVPDHGTVLVTFAMPARKHAPDAPPEAPEPRARPHPGGRAPQGT